MLSLMFVMGDPFFQVDFQAIYKFKVISKHNSNRTLRVEIMDEKNKKQSNGTLKPWIPFALCRSTISHRLSTGE